MFETTTWLVPLGCLTINPPFLESTMKHQHESSPRSLAGQLGKSPRWFVWYNDSKAIGQRAEPAPAPDERINFVSFVCRVEPKSHGSTKIQNKHTIPTHSNIFQLTPKYSITYRLIPTHSKAHVLTLKKPKNLQLLQQWHSSHHQVQQNYLVVTQIRWLQPQSPQGCFS